MEKRLRFFLAGMFLATTLMIFWNPVTALAKPIKLTYANFTPVSTFPCLQMERWKKEVEKRTNGKIFVETYPGGTLLKGKEIMDGVISGIADIGNLVSAYHPGRFVLTNAASLPLGFSSAEQASRVVWEFYKKYKPKEYSKVKVITLYSNAPANIISKMPIRSLEDIKNVDLRGSGGAATVLKSWGANAVGMPIVATVEALQKGVVKGLLTDLSALKAFKFAVSCRYVTMVDSVVYPFPVVMNLDKWNALPKDVQKVMDDLATDTTTWVGKYQDQLVIDAINWAKNEYNVEVIELPPDEKKRWDKAVSGITEKWIKDAEAKGLPGKAIVSDLKALIKKYAK